VVSCSQKYNTNTDDDYDDGDNQGRMVKMTTLKTAMIMTTTTTRITTITHLQPHVTKNLYLTRTESSNHFRTNPA
jgi:hypothetical protein